MKLKLKEDPREWLKFTAVMAFAVALITFLLHRKHVVSLNGVLGVGTVLTLALLVCSVRPKWFRGFYRAGMTASFHVGQVMGRVMLTVFFLLIVTPLGLALRLCGKDLLATKRRTTASYWRAAKPVGPFDRQF